MSSDNANIKLDGNKLRDFNKTWDGIPMFYFRKIFYLPLVMAMGSVVMDGVALRDTINLNDPGAPGIPGNAAQTNQRNARIRRIFAIMMCHIDAECDLY